MEVLSFLGGGAVDEITEESALGMIPVILNLDFCAIFPECPVECPQCCQKVWGNFDYQ